MGVVCTVVSESPGSIESQAFSFVFQPDKGSSCLVRVTKDHSIDKPNVNDSDFALYTSRKGVLTRITFERLST